MIQSVDQAAFRIYIVFYGIENKIHGLIHYKLQILSKIIFVLPWRLKYDGGKHCMHDTYVCFEGRGLSM